MSTFLKYLGNKSSVAPKLAEMLPENLGNYYEPFIGSGAMYFYLRSHRRIEKGFLSDNNYELICVYLSIRDSNSLSVVLRYLEEHKQNHSKQYYNNLRKQTFTSVERIAARYLYLNRTAFSGLMRQNDKGVFNAPMKDEAPTWVNSELLWNAQILLRDCTIKTIDFTVLTSYLQPGDFVYLDPPYHSSYENNHKHIYGSTVFDAKSQQELKRFCDWCSDRGVRFLQTNSPSELIWDLYENYDVQMMPVRYNVNGSNVQSANTEEYDLVIRNY